MKYQFPALAERCGSAVVGLFVAIGLVVTPTPAEAGPANVWPEQVTANYQITFNGFDVGQFRFNAHVGPEGYRLVGDADLSALLGVIHWKGSSRSSGWVRGNKPKPAGYTFDFSGNTIKGNVRMAFRKGEVTSFSMRPLPALAEGEVRLQRPHLKNVFDPLTAVMALTRVPGRNPCAVKLPIFDGKQRFNLQLSYKSQTRVGPVPGLPGTQIGYVCAVKYQPVAGYTPDQATMAMAREKNIEVVLRPVPGAGLMVPHEIRIPTIAGTAKLTAQGVLVRMPRRGQFAAAD